MTSDPLPAHRRRTRYAGKYPRRFEEKYKEQNSSGTEGFKKPLTVKSKKPNAWGLYDMASCW